MVSKTTRRMAAIICDKKVSSNVKEKFNKIVVRSATMYGSGCLGVKIIKKK